MTSLSSTRHIASNQLVPPESDEGGNNGRSAYSALRPPSVAELLRRTGTPNSAWATPRADSSHEAWR